MNKLSIISVVIINRKASRVLWGSGKSLLNRLFGDGHQTHTRNGLPFIELLKKASNVAVNDAGCCVFGSPRTVVLNDDDDSIQ